MEEIVYRQLGPADLDEYRRVRLECLKNYPDNFGTTVQEEAATNELKLEKAIFRSSDTDFAFGVFNSDQKMIGLCGFLTETRQKTKHRGEIVQMYIDPKYGGSGLGKTLLQNVVNKAFSNGQIEQIILSAVSENENATNLYKQAGFVEYGRLANYFKTDNGSTSQSFFVLEKAGKC